MIAHGRNHIWGGGKIEGTAGWFSSLGMKPGILHAWLASITELVCGVMLIVGFLQPFAAAGVIGVMLVALITNHLKNGFFIFRPGEGYEYVLTLLLTGFALAGIGAGKWSIDYHIDSAWLLGWKGLLIAAVFGVGGAVDAARRVLEAREEARRPRAAQGSDEMCTVGFAPSLTVASAVAAGLNPTASPWTSDGIGAWHGDAGERAPERGVLGAVVDAAPRRRCG